MKITGDIFQAQKFGYSAIHLESFACPDLPRSISTQISTFSTLLFKHKSIRRFPLNNENALLVDNCPSQARNIGCLVAPRCSRKFWKRFGDPGKPQGGPRFPQESLGKPQVSRDFVNNPKISNSIIDHFLFSQKIFPNFFLSYRLLKSFFR